MRAFAFICLAAAAPHKTGAPDAREVIRGSSRPRRLSDDFEQLAKLIAADAAEGAKFGHSVAVDGDTIVIGAPYAGTGGAVYVLRASDGAELAKLTASDAASSDEFGGSVAIDGDTIVIGANGKDDNTGAVYVLRASDGKQLATLTADDGASADNFGVSVATDGDTVVVGAMYAGTGGAAYVFRKSWFGDTYAQMAKLTANDAAADDRFGTSVAVDGGTVVIGAWGDDDDGSDSGAVYVFRTTDGGATYGQVAKLTAADAAASEYFGLSLAIAGDTVVVGASGDDDAGTSSGSAYVFRTTDGGATYPPMAKLTASDAAYIDWFGWSVAIDGATVVVGAYGDYSYRGAAYVFRTSDGGATYGQVAKLTASDAAVEDHFG